jgi:transketolase
MVCEVLSEQPVPVRIIGIPDENVVHGTNAEIFHHYCMDAEGVAKAVTSFLSEE